MKEKFQPKSNQISKKNSSFTNSILNTIIALLGILIIFLAYSVIIHIKDISNSKKETGKNNTAAAVIQVEVLNGCGASGVAEKFTDLLRKKKFDVVQMGNYISYDMDNTLVIDRVGNMANAKKVAEALGIDNKNVIMQKNDDYFLDVSLVIGKDYKKLLQ